MVRAEKIKLFQIELLKWYRVYGRKFPWRNKSATNYVRIISEVFLQRTQAGTVGRFLPGFIKVYPSWSQLSNASENDLVTILKPLGLNNQRGKKLYALAQELKKRNGVFPRERSMVEEMPMMGQYITNAFELFILKKPSPLLDGNMARLVGRFFTARKLVDLRFDAYLQALCKEIVGHEDTVLLNWSILDFASLVCKIRNPVCITCPLRMHCNYFKVFNPQSAVD